MGTGHLGRGVLTVVVGFELCRRNHADLGVQPAVVEPVDVGEGRPLDVLDSLPGSSAVDELGLVEPVEALGQGVVGGVAPAADRSDGSGLG